MTDAATSGRMPLDRRLFVADLAVPGRDEALAALVDVLFRQGRIHDRAAVLNTLRERERLGSTAVGAGVAIPHCRSMMADRLTLLCARLAQGIDFGAADGQPVRLLFLVVAPFGSRDNLYLELVGQIARALRDPQTRAALLAADDFDHFRKALEAATR